MSGYDDPYWSEVVSEGSPLERERAEADLREWELEQHWDRMRRDDPARPPKQTQGGTP